MIDKVTDMWSNHFDSSIRAISDMPAAGGGPFSSALRGPS